MSDNKENTLVPEQSAPRQSALQYPQPFPVPAPRVKIRRTGDIFDLLTLIATWVLTGELIRSVFEVGNAMASWLTTVVYFLFFILATVYIVSKKKEISLKAIPVGVAALALSCSFALHSLTDLSAVTFIAIMLLSGLYCVILTGSGAHSSGSWYTLLDVLFCEFILPLKNLFVPYPAVARGLKSKAKNGTGEKKKNRQLRFVLLGILLAIPLIFIVVPLLINTDEGFGTALDGFWQPVAGAVGKFMNTLFYHDSIIWYIISLFFTPYIFSVMFSFRYGINKLENKDRAPFFAKIRKAPASFMGAFLGVICLIYVIYLVLKAAFIFGAFTGRLPGNGVFTVTEYARQGFFEMLKIACINLALVGVSVLFFKRSGGRITGLIRVLDVFLCAFASVMVISSVAKILLYTGTMGFTVKRITVILIDAVLLVAFVCIIIRLFAKRFPYMKVIIAASVIALLVPGLGGMEKFVCDMNTSAYLSGKLETVDTEMLYSLWPSSAEALFRIADSSLPESADARRYLADELDYRYTASEWNEEHDVPDIPDIFNCSSLEEYRANKLLTSREDEFIDDLSRNKVFIWLEDSTVPVVAAYISSEKQGEFGVEAVNAQLDRNELFTLECDTSGEEPITCVLVTENGTRYEYCSDTNLFIFGTLKNADEYSLYNWVGGIYNSYGAIEEINWFRDYIKDAPDFEYADYFSAPNSVTPAAAEE